MRCRLVCGHARDIAADADDAVTAVRWGVAWCDSCREFCHVRGAFAGWQREYMAEKLITREFARRRIPLQGITAW